MKEIFTQIRDRARQIAFRFPPEAFYKDFPRANDLSRTLFETDPVVREIRKFVTENIGDNFGHGLEHAIKVTLDAGTLMQIEGNKCGYTGPFVSHQTVLVQCAGLLHDFKRRQKRHAEKGARFAKEYLDGHPFFKPGEADDIANAIRNHEAFITTLKMNTQQGALISDCLYDADKFRWGPDNFTHTVWDMIAFSKVSFSKFVRYYPKGILGLTKIKNTFRTKTGKKYGPQFIDTGLSIGEELYNVINTEFAAFL